jgi:hypothetical protein
MWGCQWTKPVFLILILGFFSPGYSQVADSLVKRKNQKAEILTSGFIDVVTNGHVNASARLVKVYIGEPGRFAVPLSIYSGVSSGNFANPQQVSFSRGNEQLINGFINPLNGLINFSFDGRVPGREWKITHAGFLYQSGFRVLTGYKAGPPSDPFTGKPINFLNSYACIGIIFQTGAWERNELSELGMFWLASRYILSYTSPRTLFPIIPGVNNGLYHGWSLGGGVDINDLVNVKIIYYRYVKEPELGFFPPICQFSFHYSLR